MFENYYETELSYLRDMGRAFAARHPAIAGMLAERGGDPDVERLLEGFAFVAARLRQRIDNGLPELVEPLAELLLPHFVRPTPATTIVELKRTKAGGGRGTYTLPAGSALSSRPVRGTTCAFRTSRAVDLLPVRLVSQRLDEGAASRPELTLKLELDPGVSETVFRPQGLRLHLHGEVSTTTQLYLWLIRHTSTLTLKAEDGRQVELGPRSISPVGLTNDDALFPWPSFSSHGVRLLLEYLTLAPKFLFIDVLGLDRAAHLEGTSFELTFRFARPPALGTRLPEGTVRLHCVPAVNLFATSAEPVRANMEGRAVLLRAAGLDPAHGEVFSVDSVIGMSAARAGRRTLSPFHAFNHALPDAQHAGFYKLAREQSPVDDGLHTFISADNGPRGLPLLDDETLSIELTCTNRSLPNELRLGDVSVATADIPAGVTFANITPVTSPTRPPLGSELSFQLIAHLAATRRSFADLAALRAFLSLYNLQETADKLAGRTNRKRIEALRAVRAETITRVVRAAVVRGTLYRVEAELSGFASEGDAFLFGNVLHGLLANQAALNTFADLELTLLPSKLAFRFTQDISR